MKKLNILTLFLFLLIPLISLAQIHFQEVTGTPFDGVMYSSIAFADIDGDNDQDIFITGNIVGSQPIAKLYTNDGNGNYSEVTGTTFDGVRHSSIAFADIDGDTDQDVLITGQNASNQSIAKLYTNDGNGNYIEMTGTPFEGVRHSSIAFADIDGDNDQDLLITGKNNSNQTIAKLYTNDGNGNYTAMTSTPFDGVFYSSIAFADIDGDNDQDVLITGSNSNFSQYIAKVYTNDGSGSFTELTGTTFEGVYDSSIAFADIDGDDDLDVLITGENNSSQVVAKLYTNNGGGGFTEMTGTPFEGVTTGSIAFADIDGDSDQDLLITGLTGLSNSFQRIATLYTNNGSGSYTEITNTSFDGVWGSSIAFADIDGDSDQDVLITGMSTNIGRIAKLYKNTTVLSIDELYINNQLSLYPNPVTDILTILSPNLNYEAQLEIVDMLGKTVWFKTITNTGQTEKINVEFLDKGIYILKVSNQNRIHSSKFIKE
jgi:predicted nucleotidyltransferase